MSYGGNGHGNRAGEWKVRELMCDIGRRIWQRGFCAGNEGNHSCRLSGNRILCTPTGMSKGFLRPDDLCTVDLEGRQLAGRRKPTSEIALHLAIYKARADVNAVVHSHPPHATAFAISGVDLPTCVHPEAELFLGPVRTARYVTPGDNRLAESVLPFVNDSNTILLQSHGVVCYDTDLEGAYQKLEIVDGYARLLILAREVGSIRPLESGEMQDLLALKSKSGLADARASRPEALACTSDFLSRVSGEVATRGMAVASGGRVVHSPSAEAELQKTIGALAPDSIDEADLEQLVQIITDQIMAQVEGRA